MADDPRTARHVPVMGDVATEYLVHRSDGTYVDATLGDAGHTERILGALDDRGRVLGVDRDLAAHARVKERFGDSEQRLSLVHAAFGDLDDVAAGSGVDSIAGVLYDLGVSSPQIDTPSRGFSFRMDGPLDMRMDTNSPMTARDALNEWPESEIARVLREYGEEPRAKSIARAICDARPINTTGELGALISRRGHERREKSLARVFQGLRIAINDELGELRRSLATALDLLEQGGRIVVIAYHSLEDRIVKRWMREEATECICPPAQPICTCDHVARLRLLTRRVVTPDDSEAAANPRARSARLRAAERL